MQTNLKSFHLRLIPPRESFPFEMTEAEQELMGRHFVFFQSLIARKIVLLAAPHLEPTCGMTIIRAESADHGRSIIADDPTVQAGLMQVEISPLLSDHPLMAHNVPSTRYVANPSDRMLTKEALIAAPVADVYRAWTTKEGLESFIAKEANVDLRVGGPFEIFFASPEAAPNRGSEDCHILSFIPNRMLSFEWNAPPEFGDLRYIYTQVVIYFTGGDGGTRVELNQLGWGEGAEWDRLFTYFDKAWTQVIDNLIQRFA